MIMRASGVCPGALIFLWRRERADCLDEPDVSSERFGHYMEGFCENREIISLVQ